MSIKVYVPPKLDIPDGIYPATIVRIEDISNRFYKDDDPDWQKTSIRWSFELTGKRYKKSGELMSVSKTTSRILTGRSVLGKLLVAVLGRPLNQKEMSGDIDLMGMINLPCRLYIKKTTNDKGDTWCNVEDVLGVDDVPSDDPDTQEPDDEPVTPDEVGGGLGDSSDNPASEVPF